MMAPRRSCECGACIPELATPRRHPGPLLCLGSRAKAFTLRGGIDVSPATLYSVRFVGMFATTSCVEFDST